MWQLVGGVGLAGSAVSLFFLWRASVQKRIASELRLVIGSLRTELATAKEVITENAVMMANQARTILYIKSEIARLEGDLDACNTPGSVRDRLRRVLSKTRDDGSPTAG